MAGWVGKAGRRNGHPERRGQLTRDSLVPQEVGPVGTDVEHQSVIRQRHGLEQRGSGSGVGLQLPETVAILSQSELPGGAQHSLRGLPSQLSLLDPKPAGERRPDGGKRVLPSRRDVGRAADHVQPLGVTPVHHADAQPVCIRVRLHLLHLGHEHIAQVAVQRLRRIDRRAQHGEPLGEVAHLQRSAEEILQPATGDVHPLLCSPAPLPAPPATNCPRNRMSPSYNRRMSGMP